MASRRSSMTKRLSGHWRRRWQAAPMPEMPAPRISTSRRSGAMGSSCMVWPSGRESQLAAPFGFERALVVVVGVEVAAEVVAQPRGDAREDAAAAEERARAAEEG